MVAGGLCRLEGLQSLDIAAPTRPSSCRRPSRSPCARWTSRAAGIRSRSSTVVTGSPSPARAGWSAVARLRRPSSASRRAKGCPSPPCACSPPAASRGAGPSGPSKRWQPVPLGSASGASPKSSMYVPAGAPASAVYVDLTLRAPEPEWRGAVVGAWVLPQAGTAPVVVGARPATFRSYEEYIRIPRRQPLGIAVAGRGGVQTWVMYNRSRDGDTFELAGSAAAGCASTRRFRAALRRPPRLRATAPPALRPRRAAWRCRKSSCRCRRYRSQAPAESPADASQRACPTAPVPAGDDLAGAEQKRERAASGAGVELRALVSASVVEYSQPV